MADRIALLVLSFGEPSSPSDVNPFLQRVYGDARVFNSPLGPVGRGLFTKLLRPTAAGDLKRALMASEATAGGDSTQARLERVAKDLCDQLNAMEGMPPSEPFAASLYASPSIGEALDKILAQNFTQLVVLWEFPFGGALAESAKDALLKYAADHPDSMPPFAFIPSWFDEEAAIAPLAESVKQALSGIPDDRREAARAVFALRPAPVSGSFDPMLKAVRTLAPRIMEAAGVKNGHDVVYLRGIEPMAPLVPGFGDLMDRLGRKDDCALALVPLTGMAPCLASIGGVKHAEESAAKSGHAAFSSVPPPFGTAPFIAMAKDAIIEHVRRSVEFSVEAAKALKPKKKA